MMSVSNDRSIEALEEEICTLAGQIAAGTARYLALLAEFDSRDGWAGPQVKSCAHWLSWKAGVDLHTAREQVRVAKSLTQLPVMAEAFASGTLSFSKVRAMTRVATEHTEESLVEIALVSPAAHLERLCRGLKKTEKPKPEESKCGGRWWWDDNGDLKVSLRLSPEDGARFLAGVTRAEYERRRTGDDAPDLNAPAPSNIAPAIIAMSEMVCAATDSPVHSPAAEVIVHVDRHDHGNLDNGPGLDEPTLHRLLCGATLRRVGHGKLGETLEVGRARRAPSRAQMRTLLMRDRCCAVPGCGRTRFLHAHHVVFWSRGGPTALDNLIMLCGEHHRSLHDGNFAIEATGNQHFEFRREDGRIIEYAPSITGSADDLAERYRHIEPSTVVPEWGGEPLNESYATDVLLRNWDLEQERRDSAA
ncbi:HNH endonuclease [Actinomycetes bacterium M1A6_2h]